ncbi:hypothetical protein BDZ91DRAFT_727325 [Kalaharituber pfeilii]|nr:hypothetical protein BDZ91DRAFT_727325 [Kalaharituber pfeilii]
MSVSLLRARGIIAAMPATYLKKPEKGERYELNPSTAKTRLHETLRLLVFPMSQTLPWGLPFPPLSVDAMGPSFISRTTTTSGRAFGSDSITTTSPPLKPT